MAIHAALTILVTLGLSLGRQENDPWSSPGETLVGVAFFGTLGLLLAYAAAWVVVCGCFIAGVVIESGWDTVIGTVVIASPVVALAATSVSFWAFRSIARE